MAAAVYESSLTCWNRGVVERDHALELSSPHLPAPGHGEGIEEPNEIRDLEIGHRVASELLEFLSRDDGAFYRHDARTHQLAEHLVRHADDAYVVHCWM